MDDQRQQFTVEEAISAIGFGKFHSFALVYAGLGWVSEAMEMMILSVVGPAIQSEWKVSPEEGSLLDTVVFVGMLIGGYFWGIVSDAYGRKMGCLGATMITAAAGLASTFSPNYMTLLVLRGILGFSVAGGHVFSTWFLEFVPAPHRGVWMIVVAAFWTLGTIFEAALAWIVMPSLGWRWLIGLSSLPSFLVILSTGFAPESLRYLCSKGRKIEAQHILEKIAQLNQTKLPIGTLELEPVVGDKEHAPPEETPLLVSSMSKTVDQESTLLLSFALFSPKLLKTTLLSWILAIGNCFGYYGIIFLISELPSAQISCSSTTRLLESSENTLYMDVLINSLAELPGLAFAAVTVDKIGRKLSMEASAVISLILLIPLFWNNNETLTTALLFGVRMFITSSFDILSIYIKEIYPTSVRSTGVGIATSVGRVGGIICPYIAVGLVRSCHQTTAIIAFQIVFALLALSVPFLPLESKGKELSDVVQE
ncbi:hypothetical protein Leryth_006721 [Lithospermum erythrorhizon]|nr:hypothetical protein Leryth_006721 [Lithospermum erythrorhizon]